MRKRNVRVGLVAAAMVLQMLAGAGAARAQTPAVTFGFNPISGDPGTKINFTGTGCPHNAAKPFDGIFFLTRDNANPSGATVQFTSDANGAFSGQYDTAGLTPAQYTTFVACTSGATATGGPGSPFTVTVPVIPGSTYTPVSPVRVLDTRDGTGTAGVINPVGQAGVIDLKVGGVSGVPANATAVALNVTETGSTAPPGGSYLTVWPAGTAQPLASNLNFYAGTSMPNLVIARLGTDGKVSIYNNLGSVNVVADLQGWFVPDNTASAYTPVNPARILDTREGIGATAAQVGPGGVVELNVVGVGGVPATGVTSVVLNVTVTRDTGPESFLTVWPSGTNRPLASNLNFNSGPPATNLVIAQVGSGGKVAFYNNLGSTDVIADVQGWFAAPVASGTALPGSSYFPISPVRVLDTRAGVGTPGGAVGQLGTQGLIDVTVAGVGGVPAGATAVVLNVTAADSPGPESFLTLFPSGTTRPVASNLNFVAGQTIPNLVIVRVSGGKVSIYNNLGSTNVIADIQGWFVAPS
jgi:hypothetical protein